VNEQTTVRALYNKLLRLYPRRFRERLGESMEQTFRDLWNEKRQTKKGFFGFVLWIFVETAVGIVREHILLMQENPMKNTLKHLGAAAGISFLLLLPFLLMEWVNRQSFRAAGEEFPIPLFIFLFVWGTLFIFMLGPIVQGLRKRMDDETNPETETETASSRILTNPRATEIVVLVLALPFLMIGVMQILNIEPPFAEALNQPDPDKPNFYNTAIPIGAFLLAVVNAFIARSSLVQVLQAQGRLFARPISLMVVLLMLLLLAWNWIGFIIDQWPCFIGVPGCD
jgi:hypothetical protein